MCRHVSGPLLFQHIMSGESCNMASPEKSIRKDDGDDTGPVYGHRVGRRSGAIS